MQVFAVKLWSQVYIATCSIVFVRVFTQLRMGAPRRQSERSHVVVSVSAHILFRQLICIDDH